MRRITQFFRLFKINIILMRYTFTPEIVGSRYALVYWLAFLNPWRLTAKKSRSRGESILFALESLGPIFVKFGQLLSTRRDLLPDDVVDELARLQDRVPPFPSQIARKIIERALGAKINILFSQFDDTPLASASIAQVHSAILHTGESVIVKILRPNIASIIKHDIALLYLVARLTEFLWTQGKRLRPVELVAEFEYTLLDELDLQREAANASQLRRNFVDSTTMYVPKTYWNYVRTNVIVMERIHGTRISDKLVLQQLNCDLKKLAENGVEMFFIQVFRDNFFHADLHPGNLFVDTTLPQNPKFIVVDFGIMGSLSPSDQHYLAQNLLAFLDRNYRRVAILHVESGWIPANTRVDLFEAAIRTVCEPIFERPLNEISFGQLLLRLFTTAARFKMEIQPQLMLLQKTLLNIEGLGRQLYPQLNIWESAKPFMERWIREQKSLKKLAEIATEDWHETAAKILKTPKLFYSVLQHFQLSQQSPFHVVIQQKKGIKKIRKRSLLLGAGLALLIVAALNSFRHWGNFSPDIWWSWTVAIVLILAAAFTSKE